MALLEPLPQIQLEAGTSGSPAEPPRRWKWTGDDLIRLGEAGLLPPEGRFELLDGEIYEFAPPFPLHAYIVDLIGKFLEDRAAACGGHAREEKPIRLNQWYDPQPDIAVVRGPERRYRDRFPGPEDILLLVEVADSSVDHDRKRKLPAYAAAGIPECWLVNLPDQRVEVYAEPVDGEYRTLHLYRTGEVMECPALSGTAIAIADLFGESGDSD